MDWCAYGGYPAVMREAKCAEAVARRWVRLKRRDYFERTGDPIWRTLGHAGHAELRQAILDGGLDNELVEGRIGASRPCRVSARIQLR